MQQVDKQEQVEESSSEESDVPDLEEEEYEVDYIVKSRLSQYGKNTVLEYFIHWKGYPDEERTWTLADQFDDDDPPVVAFYKKHPRAPRRGQSTPFSLLMGKGGATAKSAPAPRTTPRTTKATSKAVTKKAPAPGKENREVKKPRVAARSESEDFVPPEVEDDKEDEEDDDFDDNAASESEDAAEDVDEEDEDSEPAKPTKLAKKTNGSWGIANKGPKKAAVKL